MSGMTRRAFVALGIGMALGACSQGGSAGQGSEGASAPDSSSSAAPAEEERKQIEVLESGHAVVNGIVDWWAVCRNPNETWWIDHPMVRYTAYGADGNVLGTDDGYFTLKEILRAMPGQVFAVKGSFPAPDSEISRVTAEPVAMGDSRFERWDGPVPEFPVSGTSEVQGDYSPAYVGTVHNGFDFTADILVVAVLRDAEGKGVMAFDSWADGVAPGSDSAFSISPTVLPEQIPEHSSFDAYAIAQAS